MAIDARKMENVTISPIIICDDKELKEEYSKFCINRGMRYEFGTKIVCSKPKTGEKMVLCVMTIAWDDVEDFEAFCKEFDMQIAHVDD